LKLAFGVTSVPENADPAPQKIAANNFRRWEVSPSARGHARRLF
jgi:hypothetical protein